MMYQTWKGTLLNRMCIRVISVAKIHFFSLNINVIDKKHISVAIINYI